MTKTAVVILNWNGARMMRRFLPSVVEHTAGDAEVWVADNASTDDSLSLLYNEFPTVKTLVFDRNWGFAEGYNKALKAIGAEYFVLLNSDVEVTEGWLEPLVRHLDDHPDVAALQPKLLKASLTTRAADIKELQFEYAGAAGGFIDRYGYPYCRGRLFDVVEDDRGQYDSPMEIHWATGACLVIRAKDYLEAGGLDNRFFAHNEEIDLCWRLRIRGRKIMCLPESQVYHLGGGTLPQGNPRKTYLNFRNNLTMLYKNLPEEHLKKVLAVRLVLDYVAALQSLLKGNWGDVKAICKARKDFRKWKNDFNKDRMEIQANRTIKADKDLAQLSLLWQFFALGRKTWSKLPTLLLTLLMLLGATTMMADDKKTRGIGVYPGRPCEDFSVSCQRCDSYRNMAKNHAAFHSSSYDHNLTAQLVTDGLLADGELPRIEVTANGKRPVLREREWSFDGNPWTATTLVGENSVFAISWMGMKAEIDSVVVNCTVAYHPEKAVEGYDVKVLDGDVILAEDCGKDLPGKPYQYQIPLDPNKQLDYTETLPARAVQKGYRLNTEVALSELVFRLNMPGAAYWKVEEVQFYYKGAKVDSAILSSSRFQSAWMSAKGGEQWVYVDLGAEGDFDKVALHWLKFAPKGEIQVSDDARNWRRLAELPVSGLDYEIGVKGKGRYVRVLVNGSDEPYMLSELEVYGTGGTEPQHHAGCRVEGNTWPLNGGEWYVQRAGDKENWIPATVPGTVLTSYVNAGAVADQNFDDNIFYTSESFFNSDFVYRREFCLPETFKGRKVFINFDGINWKANVLVNGRKAGRIEGAFMRGRFDITDLLKDGVNLLTVEIEKVAHPGSVKTKNAYSTDVNGGLLGYDNPTFHATIGWDWITTVRGRDIGIWNDVVLTAENGVTLSDPFVDVKLNLPDTLATLSPQIVVANNVDVPLRGTLRGWVGDVQFEKAVEVLPGSHVLSFDAADYAQLRNRAMRLWWPNGYGEPYLYDAGFAFVNEQSETIAEYRFKQGIRQMTYKDKDTQLKIYCNGRRVVPLGGNWGFSEHNLNYRGREYDAAVRYHKEMNFNMIRNWVGQTGDEEFYEACDKYGVMVWQDFWLANPCDGPDPADEDMFMRNAKDYVSCIRQHASVALYCGRNEGYPPASLNAGLEKLVAAQHPGIVYIGSSADDGVSGHGPYWALPAKDYFEQQTGKLHSERGMPNVMTYEGLARTFRQEHLWPQGDAWGQHDYTMAGAQRGATFNKLIAQYGEIGSAQRFADLAQFVNYDGYRAMYESDNVHRQGLLIWMSHACWPSMTWQCYDYYFEPTAAYFGCKKACEPLHIQLNASTLEAEVANLGIGDVKNLKAEVCTYDIFGTLIKKTVAKVTSLDDSTLKLFKVDTDGVALVRMRLTDKKKVVSENTYLLKPEDLARVKAVEVKKTVRTDGNSAVVTVEAPKDAPAYMIRLKLVDGAGEQILPAVYDDNYFHLLPGEKRTVRITWLAEDQHHEGVDVVCSVIGGMK